MMYVFPLIYTYGVLASVISDTTGRILAKKSGDPRVEIMVSGSLHIVFGLVLLLFSLIGAIVFFLTDRILLKLNQHYTWVVTLISLVIPLLSFFLFILLN